MKRLFIYFLPLFAILGCKSEGEAGPNDQVEQPELILAELEVDMVGRYDRIVYQDDEHYILTDFYDNGLVREYCVVCQQDTLGVFYSDDGFPKYISDGQKHIVLSDFSEHSVLIGRIDENGEYEICDLETSINWCDYKNNLEDALSASTKGKTFDKQLEYAQSTVKDELLYRLFTGAWGSSLSDTTIRWIVFASLYCMSDDPTYWEVVDCISDQVNLVTLVLNVSKHPNVMLTLSNILVWSHVIDLVFQGIENGDFRSIFPQDPDLFVDAIEGGIWFGASSSAILDWQDHKLSVPVRLGIANFDYTVEGAFEIGVRKNAVLPKGWTAEIVGTYGDYTLEISIPSNETDEIIACDIPVYTIGAYNIQDDLIYTIQQAPKIQFDPDEVYFDDIEPVTVIVTSMSKEKWEVGECPSWLDYDVDKMATREVNSITLTPRYLEGASEGNVVFTVTTNDGRSSYMKCLPVYPSARTPFIYAGHVLCPDHNHPHAIDLGLSVKWACCDVGASDPLAQGGLFAWGETETKEYKTINTMPATYCQPDYKWYREGVKMTDEGPVDISGYTKYNTEPCLGYDGFTDGKTTLDLEDDAAHANWGGNWRMPTRQELMELHEMCAASGFKLDLGGGIATGPSGNSIYMANRTCYGPTIYFTYGYLHVTYWSSTLDKNFDSWWKDCMAWGVLVDRRYVGQAVRPVCE